MTIRLFPIAVAALCVLASCSKPAPSGPVAIFPGAEAPGHGNNAYSMTESPDGTIRIYTQEDDGEAWLYEMHKTDKTWSEPARMDLPGRKRLKGRASVAPTALCISRRTPSCRRRWAGGT
ncbi:MAG: hypothetical protein ACPH9E_04550 [Hyphomonas sp.]